MKKQKLTALLLSMLLIATFGMTGCGDSGGTADSGGDDKVYEFKVSHIASEADPIHQGWSLLKETLEEKSEGRIEVTIYGNKQLSNSNNEDAEKVQQNIVQASSVPTSSLASMGDIKQYQIFDYPYLFESEDELYEVLDSDLAKDWSDKLTEKCGVKAYGGYNLGWCKISSNKGEIKGPTSLKGQKIRTMSSDLQMGIINSLGASATIVNYGELFTACQQGTVDGMMTSTGLYVSDKFYECQKYLGCTDAIALLHVPIINASWYNELPEDLQKVFDESMAIYLEGVREFEMEFEANALDELREAGMIVTEYSDTELQAFKDATASVFADYASVAGQDTIDAVREMLGK